MSNKPTGGDPAAQALATLDMIGLEYEILECDPDLADTAVFCEHYNIPLSAVSYTHLTLPTILLV